MAIIALVLIWITLFCLNKYTKHGQSITVPNLSGMQVDEAEKLIYSAGLSYEVVDSLYNESGTPGAIVEQIPLAESHVKKGRTIYLTVQAVNEQLIAVPDLEDASLRQAQVILQSLGFKNVQIKRIPSQYQDLVFGVEYKGVTLKAGQKVPINAPISLIVGDGGAQEDSIIDDTAEAIAEID